jgi:hypothetical protein
MTDAQKQELSKKIIDLCQEYAMTTDHSETLADALVESLRPE